MGIVVVLGVLVWVWMIFDCLTREERGPWALALLLGPPGGVVYFFAVYLRHAPHELPGLREERRLKELKALERHGLTGDQLREMGDLYRERGAWADAATCYQKALQQFPSLQSLRLNMVHCLLESGRGQDAVAELKEVAAKDAFYRDRALVLLGQTLLQLGKTQEALEQLTLVYHPSGPVEAQYWYAMALKANGRRDDAKSAFEQLVASAPLLSKPDRRWVSEAKEALRSL